MSKLTTPVQYEPSLKELNALRPLQLTNVVKIGVAYPILCKNPPTKDRPAVGKLVRCSQQGSLLKSNSVKYHNVELIQRSFHELQPNRSITFSQPVSIVYAVVFSYYGTPTIYWCDSAYTIMFVEISYNQNKFLPFVGQTIYFHFVISGADWIVLSLYGFY